MSLKSLVRNAVATAHKVTKDLQVTVTHEAYTGLNGDAKATYASGVDYLALVEKRVRRFRNDAGEDIMSQHLVTFLTTVAENGTAGRSEPIDTRDRITLPDGTVVPILHVAGGILDPLTGQPYLHEVYLG